MPRVIPGPTGPSGPTAATGPSSPTAPQPNPAPVPPPAPKPQPKADIGDPQGVIAGAPANNGQPWSQINQYDQSIKRWAKKFPNVDYASPKAMIVVESGGVNLSGGEPGSTGILQIKPQIWNDAAAKLGVSLDTPDGQIAVCFAILSGQSGHGNYGTPEENFRRLYFTGDDPNGITQDAYARWAFRDGPAIIHAAEGGTTPAPVPHGPTEAAVLRLVAGPGASVGFGFNEQNISCGPSGNQPCHFYEYGVNHGTDCDYCHTGIDMSVPRGTSIHTPVPGRITCVGVQGQVIWGEGCGSYEDERGGIGNVTLMSEQFGVKLVFGHCSSTPLQLGQEVSAGAVVALSGTNRSDHCHLDVTTERNGSYWLNDPLPTLVRILGGLPLPEVYAEPAKLPQPQEWTTSATVTVIADSVPVLQHADLTSPKVAPDIKKGDTFEAVATAIGDDKRWYWVGHFLGGRVPMEGTEGPLMVRQP